MKSLLLFLALAGHMGTSIAGCCCSRPTARHIKFPSAQTLREKTLQASIDVEQLDTLEFFQTVGDQEILESEINATIDGIFKKNWEQHVRAITPFALNPAFIGQVKAQWKEYQRQYAALTPVMKKILMEHHIA